MTLLLLARSQYGSEKQSLIARAYRNGLSRRFGGQPLNATPIELPDADAVPNEAIERVLGEHAGYAWDGNGAFDAFFRRCMMKSMEALRSTERTYRRRAREEIREIVAINFAGLPPDAREIGDRSADEIASQPAVYKRALAAAIVRNRMGSTMKRYMEHLPTYSCLKMTTGRDC